MLSGMTQCLSLHEYLACLVMNTTLPTKSTTFSTDPAQVTTFPADFPEVTTFSGDLPRHPSASLPVQVIQCKSLQRGVSLAVEENRLQTRNIASGKSFSHGSGGKWVANLFGVHGALVYIKQPSPSHDFFFSNGSLVSRHKSHTAGLNPALPVSLSPQSPRSTSQRLDPLVTLTSQRDMPTSNSLMSHQPSSMFEP